MKQHTELIKAALDYFETLDFMAWKNNTGVAKMGQCYVRFGKPGSADISLLHKGIFYGIEAKTEGDKQRPDQKEFQADLVKNGGAYIIIYSLDDVITFVKSIK